MRTLASFRAMPPVVRLLLINQLGVMFGFYLLVPFLAVYLREDLMLATAAVGAIIGVRSLSQQGLTVLGGTAADRFGCRPVIIVGCALRTVGFGLFAAFDNIAGLLLAAVITGLAGAVFSPATRAYLALESGQRRLEAFALFTLAYGLGALTGPLVGALLIGVDFRWVAIAAAAVFALLTVAQLFALPDRRPEQPSAPVLRSWRIVFTDRRFVAFSVSCAGLFTLYNQLYLAVPLAATRAIGQQWAAGAVFAVSTVLTLLWQVRLTAAVARRLSPAAAIAAGLAVMGLAFLPTTLIPGGTLFVLPVLLTTVLLTLGHNIAEPFANDLAAGLARPGMTGTYLGVFSMGSGLAAVAGNTLVGWLSDLAGTLGLPWLSWLVLVLIGLASAAAVFALHRGGALRRTAPEYA